MKFSKDAHICQDCEWCSDPGNGVGICEEGEIPVVVNPSGRACVLFEPKEESVKERWNKNIRHCAACAVYF